MKSDRRTFGKLVFGALAALFVPKAKPIFGRKVDCLIVDDPYLPMEAAPVFHLESLPFPITTKSEAAINFINNWKGHLFLSGISFECNPSVGNDQPLFWKPTS